MKDGKVIPYVSKYVHLGTTIYIQLYRDHVIDVVMNCINVPTIYFKIFLLLRVALYPINLIVIV